MTRSLADFDFEITRLFHMAAEAHDARAGVVRRAELRVFRRAHRHDVLYVAQCLHVIHDRRAHVEPEHGREKRRLDARLSFIAFERFDKACFFTADIGACSAMHDDIESKA